MSSRSRGWADLPTEIIKLIGNRLQTRVEVFRFRAVCTSWRSSVVVPLTHNNTATIFPPLKFPSQLRSTSTLSSFSLYRLEDETRSSACLVKVTEESTSSEPKFMNPLYTRKNPVNFIVNTIDVLSLRVVEVCKVYCLEFKYTAPHIKKVVLFGNSGIIVINGEGKLGYLGFKDENWTNMGDEKTTYDDIALYMDQIYVVDNIGTVFWVDGKSMSLVQYSPTLFGPGQVKNLVVSDGEMYVVDSYLEHTRETEMPTSEYNYWDNGERVDMRVYRLDEEWGNWVEVKSLGDRVFVLAEEVSFSVTTKDFPGCVGNCVYFVDTDVRRDDAKLKRKFVGVFDIGDGRRMKKLGCFPCLQKLFSVFMNFPISGSSFQIDISG